MKLTSNDILNTLYYLIDNIWKSRSHNKTTHSKRKKVEIQRISHSACKDRFIDIYSSKIIFTHKSNRSHPQNTKNRKLFKYKKLKHETIFLSIQLNTNTQVGYTQSTPKTKPNKKWHILITETTSSNHYLTKQKKKLKRWNLHWGSSIFRV